MIYFKRKYLVISTGSFWNNMFKLLKTEKMTITKCKNIISLQV